MNNSSTGLQLHRIAESLNLTEERVEELLEKKNLHITPAGHLILEKSTSHIESGTAIFPCGDYEVIRGFPKIQRAIVLQPTLSAHFNCPRVAVEEKMNGYNTRVALINNKIIALTRGGHICPYTTEKARILIPERIFKEHPEWVLCGEMVGPDSPYVPKDVYQVESLQFYLFDIREKNTGTPLSVADRYRIAEEYGIPSVRLFGTYPLHSAHEDIRRIIQELGARGREGVVIKDPLMHQPPIKYTSSQSNCRDLQYAFTYFHEYARSFFYSRIIREAFQSVEWGETPEEVEQRCRQLGESILRPMIASIKKIQCGEKLSEDVQIRVQSLTTAERFKEHLRILGIDAIFHPPQQIKGEYLIKIQKINHSTSDKIESLLQGHTW